MLLKKLSRTSILGAASAIVLMSCVVGAAAAQQAPDSAAAKPAGQLAPRDTSKLPTTFAAAEAAAPSDPKWPRAYKPKSKRDLTGMWERADARQRQGAGGRGQGGGGAPPAPMTPAYAAV